MEFLVDQSGDDINIESVIFRNLNRKVTSVFIQPNFDKHERLEARIRWTDECDIRESGSLFGERGIADLKQTLYKRLPHENHIATQTIGNVSELEISFSDGLLLEDISQIAINKQIPYYFSGLRLLAVSLIFFAVILFAYKPLRAKTAYYLFEYKFDPANKKQTLIYACLVILTLFFSWFCVYTSITNQSGAQSAQYKYMVDAFIAGKTNLDWGHPEKLLDAERPYNKFWLWLHGYKSEIDFSSDVAYYNGNFYCYYGVVPAALLYIPYKLVTGNYMSNYAAIFIFAAIAVVFLAFLWRFLVKKYMPDARFAFVSLSFLTLFFVSHLFSNIRSPSASAVVTVSGFAFTVLGTFLLLKSIDKESTNRVQLFFACLCFALAVGCRPSTFFVSFLVPTVLWKRRSLKLALFVLIPYVMVAVPLCLYNYVRFDSIFQFGQEYCVIASPQMLHHLLNPLAKIHKMFIITVFYLFRLYVYSLHFPFVHHVPPQGFATHAVGFTLYHNQSGGLINFPILFCLIYLIKNIFCKEKPRGFYLSSIFLIIAIVTVLIYAKLGIFHARYLLDCSIFFILPSLFCAYYWSCDKQHENISDSEMASSRLKVIYVLLTISIFVGVFLFVSGHDHSVDAMCYDPTLYRYLEYSLGIIGRI